MRNAGPWITVSIASLVRQTERDLEIVAVDDGSTDDTSARLADLARREPRLRIVTTPARGLPAALETARAAASGAYLARHDADDLSHRRRLELQLDHLAQNPDVAVVGSRLRLFPTADVGQGMRRWARWHDALLDHEAMAHEVLIDSPLAHGSALFRRAALESVGGWHERGWPEDLDLWLRMIEAGLRLGKCREKLYAWRQHGASATRADARYAPERFRALKLDALARGALRGRDRATLVGVGTSAAGWVDALATIGVRAERIDAARPAPGAAPTPAWTLPIVLVFGAQAARDRWRHALLDRGLAEGRDFVFVA